jgi:hypothetical protein
MEKINISTTVFAIDFDGTCVKHNYPEVGNDVGAVPTLKRIVEEGGKLILWTMRSGPSLNDAINWFKKNNITLYSIQRNPTQDMWTSSPKAYAHVYIDDAALGCPLIYPSNERPYVDWSKINHVLWPQKKTEEEINLNSYHSKNYET